MSRPTNPSRARSAGQVVEVKAVTWNKDSHGLFDYENSYYDMKKFQIGNSTLLFRQNNEIQSRSRNGMEIENEENSEFLLSISKKDLGSDKFVVDIAGVEGTPTRNAKPSYLIVRSLKCRDGRSQRGYPLQPGDVMKLGRVEYKVIEIRNSQGQFSVENQMDIYDQQNRQTFDADVCKINEARKETGEPMVCKYCLLETVPDCPEDLANLMLYICDCCEGVHFQCLKMWMQYKIILRTTQNVTSYQWKKLDCEICLKQWPKKIKFQGVVHELITLNRPAGPYMIIEKPSVDPNTPSTMNIIVPSGADMVKMGRGHQCDLRISDISVSRIHTHIKFEHDQFLAFDNDSKFGTLILLNKDYPVRTEKAAIQIGRTVFTFVLKTANQEPNGAPNSSQIMG
jgi:hypothetical protein